MLSSEMMCSILRKYHMGVEDMLHVLILDVIAINTVLTKAEYSSSS
jgi:hypothetical protein